MWAALTIGRVRVARLPGRVGVWGGRIKLSSAMRGILLRSRCRRSMAVYSAVQAIIEVLLLRMEICVMAFRRPGRRH
jgi:hypothetical protein